MFEARPWKVKGLDLLVNRCRVRRDGGPRWEQCRRSVASAPHTCGVVLWHVRRGGARLRGVASLKDGAAGGTWKGETDASGLHGGGVAVGLARMLLPGVPLYLPDTTGWRGPLVKALPWKVKGLDLMVDRSRVRRDGGPGGSNATGASHRPLIHAGWCCGMSEEAACVSGVWPPSRTAMT